MITIVADVMNFPRGKQYDGECVGKTAKKFSCGDARGHNGTLCGRREQ